jgi:hypothetical protein
MVDPPPHKLAAAAPAAPFCLSQTPSAGMATFPVLVATQASTLRVRGCGLKWLGPFDGHVTGFRLLWADPAQPTRGAGGGGGGRLLLACRQPVFHASDDDPPLSDDCEPLTNPWSSMCTAAALQARPALPRREAARICGGLSDGIRHVSRHELLSLMDDIEACQSWSCMGFKAYADCLVGRLYRVPVTVFCFSATPLTPPSLRPFTCWSVNGILTSSHTRLRHWGI